MPDILKKIWDKIEHIIFRIMKFFDKLSEKLKVRTGTNINVGVIVCIVFVIFVILFVMKLIFGWVMSSLTGN